MLKSKTLLQIATEALTFKVVIAYERDIKFNFQELSMTFRMENADSPGVTEENTLAIQKHLMAKSERNSLEAGQSNTIKIQ